MRRQYVEEKNILFLRNKRLKTETYRGINYYKLNITDIILNNFLIVFLLIY